MSMRKGWLILFIMLRQFMMIFFFLFFTITYLSITFIAQKLPSFLNLHRNTFEKPPEPISFIIQKLSRVRDYLQSTLLSLHAGLRYRLWPFKNCPEMVFWVSRQSKVIWTGTDLKQQTLGYSFLKKALTSPICTTSM